MQIAKMFASLGFKVDKAGLDDFKKGLQSVKNDMSGVTSEAKKATAQLDKLKNKAKDFRKEISKASSGSNSIVGINKGKRINTSVKGLNSELDKLVSSRKKITNSIGKINASVQSGSPMWDKYRESVVKTRKALQNVNRDMKSLRKNSTVSLRVTEKRSGSYGRGGRGGVGGLGSAIGTGMGFGTVAGFLRGGIVPATALTGLTTTLGYAVKEIVQAGRDQTRMQSMLQMTSKDGEEFARTLRYVRGEATRLGLSSTELGKSFAQINMSAKGLSQDQKEAMFTGFSEFMMAMGTSSDDQKGIFRAFNQMFSNNRILQEEINQLSERGIPATLVQNAAMKAYGTNDVSYIKKLQEDGQLDPTKVLPVMAKMVQQMAHDTGAYDKMMNSSIVKQGQFIESLRQLSTAIMNSGADEALGRLFGKLTMIVEALTEAVEGVEGAIEIFKSMKEVIDKLTNGNSWLIPVLGLVALNFRSLFKVGGGVVGVLKAQKSITGKLGALLRGLFSSSIVKIAGKFFFWIQAISGVIYGLRWIRKELKKRDNGELNAIDQIIWKFEEMGAWIDLAQSKMEYYFESLKAFASNPIKFSLGVDSNFDTFGTRIRHNPSNNSPVKAILENKKSSPPKPKQNSNGAMYGAGGNWGGNSKKDEPNTFIKIVNGFGINSKIAGVNSPSGRW